MNSTLGFQYSNESTQSAGIAYELTKSDPKGTYVIRSYCKGKKIEQTLSAKNKKTGKVIYKKTQSGNFAPTTKNTTKTIYYSKN